MKNISTYGAKALFYININDEPPFILQETLAEGSSFSDPVYSNVFKIPGEYTITGKLLEISYQNEMKFISKINVSTFIYLSI